MQSFMIDIINIIKFWDNEAQKIYTRNEEKLFFI